ncbi:hypothetical protein V1477_016475 [Vespula maculifrons]|uniref:Uncharacterized protein n=1 Tax=Vespula maculifrons TaxID=7453 RepID=A0ABD2B9C5_VESMC
MRIKKCFVSEYTIEEKYLGNITIILFGFTYISIRYKKHIWFIQFFICQKNEQLYWSPVAHTEFNCFIGRCSIDPSQLMFNCSNKQRKSKHQKIARGGEPLPVNFSLIRYNINKFLLYLQEEIEI